MSISNSNAVIDSRGVIARIKELQEALDNVQSDRDEDDLQLELEDLTFGDQEELDALKALAEEAEGYGDWAHGETLINKSYFTEYAEQLAEDIGAIDRKVIWPLNHINWEAAAEDLLQDYTAVDFDGITFYVLTVSRFT